MPPMIHSTSSTTLMEGFAGSQSTSLALSVTTPDPVILHLVYSVHEGDINFIRGNPGCANRHNSDDAGEYQRRE